jgi:hypothetical protein
MQFTPVQHPLTDLWVVGVNAKYLPVQTTFAKADIERVCRAANACAAAKIHDPEHELPALKRLAVASIELSQAQDRLNKAHKTWRRFTAHQDYADAAHGEHHEKFLEAERLLKDTRAVFDLVLREYQELAGEGTTVEKIAEAA